MSIRQLGIILIIGGCSATGFSIGTALRRETRQLEQLIRAVAYMANQLRYTLTPLPELCRQAGSISSGALREVFLNLSRELEWQVEPDVYSCTAEALRKSGKLSGRGHSLFLDLGRSLGQFDLEGQLQELQRIEHSGRNALAEIRTDQQNRVKSCRTLGICAGVALAILMI